MRATRDGQPIGPKQTITAEQQEAILRGPATAEPRPARLALTPAQARRQMSGDWIGDDLDPPNYEASVISDPDAIANALGLRPSDFDGGAPLGSLPEGQPVAPPAMRPKIEPRSRDEGAAINAPSDEESAAVVERESEALRRQAAAHAKNTRTRIAEAQANGSPEAKKAALADAAASATVLGTVKKLLGS